MQIEAFKRSELVILTNNDQIFQERFKMKSSTFQSLRLSGCSLLLV